MIDFIVPLLAMVFFFIAAASQENKKKEAARKLFEEEAEKVRLEDNSIKYKTVLNDDTSLERDSLVSQREKRILDQKIKVNTYSEAQQFVRLSEMKKPLSNKQSVKRDKGAQAVNKHHQEPTRVVSKKIFQDKEEVQKAFIYSEIFSKPKALRKNN